MNWREVAFGTVVLILLGLAGCATRPSASTANEAAFVGVFTGDYVDGKPLYRFPSIQVFGSWSDVTGD